MADVEISSQPIDLAGSAGQIFVATDVTERLAAERSLAARERAVRESQRMEALGRLAGGVAHDFNNILTAISGYAEIIRANRPANDPELDDIQEILNATDRASTLTKQLLAFSRQQVLQPAIASLNDVILGMTKMLHMLVGARIEIDLRLDPALRPAVVDRGQMEQVLLNLCVNARDAMPGGGKIVVETANVIMDGTQGSSDATSGRVDFIKVVVIDTGTGMDAATRARIFEPFFTTKAPDRGTGLGLATVYGIVKQMGGEITVSSEVGEGSMFTILLPAAS